MNTPKCERCMDVNQVSCTPNKGFRIPFLEITIGDGRTMYQRSQKMGDLKELIVECPVILKETTPEEFWPADGGAYIADGELHKLDADGILFEALRRRQPSAGTDLL